MQDTTNDDEFVVDIGLALSVPTMLVCIPFITFIPFGFTRNTNETNGVVDIIRNVLYICGKLDVSVCVIDFVLNDKVVQ